VAFVVRSAVRRFNGDRFKPERAHVVGAGAHVDFAPVPRLRDQAAIAEYLDAKERESHLISSPIETQIATLTAYRKSLCVTGQRWVGD
jgi:hypothetical protein